jgi:uncharacterized membrane protein
MADQSEASAADSEFGRDIDRVVAFSDAVFAIAMTLLALSLRLPSGTTRGNLGSHLVKVLPHAFAYFLSFGVIGLYWLSHHRMFHYIRRLDPTMLRLNLLLLSLVAAMPFPTDVLATEGGTTAAYVLYAGMVAALGLTSTAVWLHASRGGRLIRADTPEVYVRHATARSLVASVVFLASIPVAFIDPYVAAYCWILILPAQAVLARRYGRIWW